MEEPAKQQPPPARKEAVKRVCVRGGSISVA